MEGLEARQRTWIGRRERCETPVEHGRHIVAGSLSSRSTVPAERGASSRARICCSVSVGVRGDMVSGRIRVCGSPSPKTCM